MIPVTKNGTIQIFDWAFVFAEWTKVAFLASNVTQSSLQNAKNKILSPQTPLKGLELNLLCFLVLV